MNAYTTLTDIDENKIMKYRDLIKKHGPMKAADLIKQLGISYDEDFTVMHKTDPIFSSKMITPSSGIARLVMPQHIAKMNLKVTLLKKTGAIAINSVTFKVGSSTKFNESTHTTDDFIIPTEHKSWPGIVEEIDLTRINPILSTA